ncbi:Seryl-tRNA synthetase [Liberibacter crescens BT-1]|uniref:Serine--tRNA ligase n=1 Tax=Liberibacter crescens (strain BT-1) TaxID=1215343 RepID=L0EWT2_LIBCB|nr:serine--tRNA ligase [Liberibacter crescens]AGA65103.1 Seryl-tRNA synthetase [Liberibacter crescens BT-1]AMC13082.1 serine--tRNA ligase [Liberibacter crescens]
MLDIKWIRKNPNLLDKMLKNRGLPSQASSILSLDANRSKVIKAVEDIRARRNYISKQIEQALADKNDILIQNLKEEIISLKTQLPTLEHEERQLDISLKNAISFLPNILLDEVPVGSSENDNIVTRVVGEKPDKSYLGKEHFEIGEALGYMDFERAVKLSGSRFSVLTSQLACLERALGQFMLDIHTTKHNYIEISAPFIVRKEAMYGTGQLPKFAADMFCTTDERWLIPTAEVTLTNLVANEIIDHDKLPLRFTALTPSFRSEAGSAGRDTRGMLRQHQFWKCELVSITDTKSSVTEHERMTACAEEILKRLDLHYRVVNLCTSDIGFSACKTYDIEVWLPGQNNYREISSCSICNDFQSRRMNSRYHDKDSKSLRFTHTLNGSGVAVGRCLIAILETYLNEDGSVTIPNALLPYMCGLKKIEKLNH